MMTIVAMVLFCAAIACHHEFIDLGACTTNADCADGDPCTVNICDVDRICIQIPSDNPACDPEPECVPTDEVCNGRDDDCDGAIDEDTYCAACSGGPTMPYYRDADYDGFGDPELSERMCSGVGATGWIDIAGDCDDSSDAINPDAQELCDGLDNDCDGETDEDYREILGDTCVVFNSEGFCSEFGVVTCGTPGEMYQLACNSLPVGTTWSIPLSDEMCGNGLDDDCDGVVEEGCVETCNGIDDNLDGNTDEGLLAMYYRDADYDGFGDPAWFMRYGCPGEDHFDWVTNRGDCNDADPEIHPGAGCPACDIIYFRDADSDAHGDPMSGRVFFCDDGSVVGYITTIGDCDDTDSAVYVAAYEFCDEIDNDCDGTVDEDCP